MCLQMPPPVGSIAEERWSFWRIHQYVLVFLACSLSATVILKIGEVQYLELIFALDFLVLMWLFARNNFQIRVLRPIQSIATSYAIFLAAALLLGLIALRQDFYLVGTTLLKRPLVVTIARAAELFLDVFYMLYLASLFHENKNLCAFGAKVYFWTGISGAIYSIVTFPLNYFLGLQLGTYLDTHRLRGFDNEGGPYGLYLLSLLILLFAIRQREWLNRRQLYWGLGLFSVCFIGSQSKAAFFCVAVLGILFVLSTLRGWRMLAAIGTLSFGLLVLAAQIDIPGQIQIYFQAIETYQQLSNMRPTDGNLVKGRIAGTVLAPRMIEAHPLLGIGWGNYALVRDDPQYRRGSAFSFGSGDSPSLGTIDYIVDLGFPLWIYMVWISFKPLHLLRQYKADVYVLALAAMQPMAILFGTHLNIMYQWITLALALGMGFSKRPNQMQERAR